MAVKWKDKKKMCVLGTVHSDEVVQMQNNYEKKFKPAIVVEYNKNIGGVDLYDQYLVSYLSAQKLMDKYYKKQFQYQLDMIAFSGYLLYVKSGG